MPLGLMPAMSYEEKETILHSGEAASSTVMGWSRRMTQKARCSASLGLGRWSPSTLRRER